MIKVIYGKTGEGKTVECIKEIQNDTEAKLVAVVDEEGDITGKLLELIEQKVITEKSILFLNKQDWDKINNGIKFDLIVIDILDSWNTIFNKLQECDYNKAIITQQTNSEKKGILRKREANSLDVEQVTITGLPFSTIPKSTQITNGEDMYFTTETTMLGGDGKAVVNIEPFDNSKFYQHLNDSISNLETTLTYKD